MWARSDVQVPYVQALAFMDQRANAIASGTAPELIWLLEHPALYTAGTSARAEHLIDPHRLPVHWTGRGGAFTYHGPGQRIVYTLLDVRGRFDGDVRALVRTLERWIIETLSPCGITGHLIAGRTGVWVETAGASGVPRPAKIASIGLRVRRGVSLHGFAINVAPDLSHFAGIVPCAIADAEVTSLAALGSERVLKDVDNLLRSTFERLIGPAIDAPEIKPEPSAA
jgi:lipoyl(octanoyl) transferase